MPARSEPSGSRPSLRTSAKPAPSRSATAPPRMNPRDSMPATTSTCASTVRRGKRGDRRSESGRVPEQQRDVLEDDAGAGEIRHIADQRAQPFHHVLLLNRHRSQSIRHTLWPCPRPARPLTMRVVMDGRPLQGASSVRGIGSYERGLLAGFAELADPPEVSLLLSAHPSRPPEVTSAVLPSARRIPVIHPTLQPVADTVFVARALRGVRADLYHAIEFGQPLRTRLPVVVTVHDLIPFVHAPRLPVGPPSAGAGVAPAAPRRRGHRRLRRDPPGHAPIHQDRSRAHHGYPRGSRAGVPAGDRGSRRRRAGDAAPGPVHSCLRSVPSTRASASRSSPMSCAAFARITTSPWSSPVIRAPSSNPSLRSSHAPASPITHASSGT